MVLQGADEHLFAAFKLSFAEFAMPTRQNLELGRIRPLRLFGIILIVLFTIEVIVMLVLPYLAPAEGGKLTEALIDACLLTGVLAPLLWYLIVQPLQRLAANRQRLLAITLSAQEDERGRIARDLHDSLGQALTGLLIGLRTIEGGSQEESVQLQARELRRIGGEMHEEVRRLSRGLRPAVLDDLGLVPALERLVADLAASQQIAVTFERDCQEEIQLPGDVQTTVYRIVQESVANAVRHGKPQRVQVKMSCSTEELKVSICDDGTGFDLAAALGAGREDGPFGLLSIQERASLLGGEAAFTSRAGQGTQVQVLLPLRRTAAKYG